MSQKRIAINGFGRIGRLFFRQACTNKDIQIVAINDLGNIDNLAYLLKYDTVYGRFEKEVGVKEGNLIVDGKEIRVTQIKEPRELPWGEMKIDVVVEATGVFTKYELAKAHVEAGAKRVVITAPSKDVDGTEGKTILVGVNDDDMKEVVLTSNGSCTTNAASPVISVVSESVGIEKAVLSTVHGYTATQSIVDSPTRGSDFRKARAGAQNIIPSTTGAAIAVARAIPELEGRFDGIALRVPVVVGSIADITFVTKRNTTVEEINGIFREAVKSPRWQGILAVTSDPIVSSDIIGEPYGAIVDLAFTKVVGGNLVKVLSWYDNEAGYVSTLIKHVVTAAKTV
jgi:glyceraldehyde 3-phosphate dehydrogenase